jgi:hypothetical protein
MAKIEIDLEEFAEQVKRGQSVTAKGGVLNGLLKVICQPYREQRIKQIL